MRADTIMGLASVGLALGGCASLRFEAAVQACDVAAEADPGDVLGHARIPEPPTGALVGGARTNHEAAPPWVVGQARVYPFDPWYPYAAIMLEAGRHPTPLLCRATYDGTQRRALFAADPLTNVELSAVYEVPGKSPQLFAHGPRDVPAMSVLDPATELAPGDELRIAVVDRDSRWGRDDPLVDFLLLYTENGVAAGGQQLWRGAVRVRCGHLEPEAARQAHANALAVVDAGLAGWAPQLVPDGWDYGLSASGMTSLRSSLQRAASLRLQGWDAPEVRERAQRLLATQLCFERAAEPEVARHAARVARRDPAGLWDLRIVGTAYACETDERGASTCRLTAAVSNPEEEPAPVANASHVQLVLAGGREIPLTIERSTVGGRTYEGLGPDVPGGATATVIYRLAVPLRDDRPLARPVMLRERKWRFFSDEHFVRDHPVRLDDQTAPTAAPAARTAATR